MEDKCSLKVGDVVRLKSGGPKMTVDTKGENGRLYAIYFDRVIDSAVGLGSGDERCGSVVGYYFEPASLILAE